MWQELVDNKKEWKGGVLEEICEAGPFEQCAQANPTKIKNIKFKEEYIDFIGEDYSCGFDIELGGVIPGEEGWLTMEGPYGHQFRIRKPE